MYIYRYRNLGLPNTTIKGHNWEYCGVKHRCYRFKRRVRQLLASPGTVRRWMSSEAGSNSSGLTEDSAPQNKGRFPFLANHGQ